MTIHTAHKAYLERDVLGRLEAQLDPRHLVRIHRSHIVNFDFVHELKQDAHEVFEVLHGDRARLFVHDQQQPTLIVNDVKSGAQGKGGIALWIGPGAIGYFRNLSVRP